METYRENRENITNCVRQTGTTQGFILNNYGTDIQSTESKPTTWNKIINVIRRSIGKKDLFI